MAGRLIRARTALTRTLAWLVAFLSVSGIGLPAAAQPQAEDRFIVMASTTSTEQSGLFAHLLPAFSTASGIAVRVVALGTGQALDLARRGDADVLFVHDAAAEDAFVAEGHGLRRIPVMYNDFILVGPVSDPAGVKGPDIVRAFSRLADVPAVFISRGDQSGTHAAELRIWKLAGLAAPGARVAGYKACGCGMGQALNMAAATDGYVLADRGTWISFRNRGGLSLLVEGDARLRNPYGVIVVDKARHPHVKADLAQAFATWVTGPEGQARIAAYRIDGQQLFFPQVQD